jgi:hypothetical protein
MTTGDDKLDENVMRLRVGTHFDEMLTDVH